MRGIDEPGGKGAIARRRLTAKAYFLVCCRTIELNPVRARMVRNPRDDAWSSDNAHARRAMDPHLGGHALFDRLGASPADRRGAYRELFRGATDADFADALRAATNGGWALGDACFKRQIAKALDRQGGLGQMQLERAQLFGGRAVGGTAEEARELLDSTDILALRIGHEPAHVHVIEHALAQRADGLLAHWGLLS
jgi:hypothetical protein